MRVVNIRVRCLGLWFDNMHTLLYATSMAQKPSLNYLLILNPPARCLETRGQRVLLPCELVVAVDADDEAVFELSTRNNDRCTCRPDLLGVT